MKIGIINSVYKFGSTGRICFDIANYFNSKNINTRVYYGRGKKIKDNISYKFSYPFSFLTHVFLARLFDGDSKYSYFSTKRLISKLKKDNIDTIILNNIHGYYINLKTLANYISKNNIQTYYIMHDCWSFTGHCAHFSKVNCEKFKNDKCLRCPYKNIYPKSWLFSFSKQNLLNKEYQFSKIKHLTFISPSKWLMENFQHSILKNNKVVCINNGIDLNIFKKSDNNLFQKFKNDGKNIILCVSSLWTKNKGYFDIFKVLDLLPQNYIFIIIGKLKYKKIINERVIYVNRTNSPTELANFYSSADIMFNPSHEDSYPTVNLEAAACLCPVVAYDVCGVGETLNKEYCFIEFDYMSIKNAIINICSNKEKYKFIDKESLDKNTTYNKYYQLIVNKSSDK